jgi:hypothetical protein
MSTSSQTIDRRGAHWFGAVGLLALWFAAAYVIGANGLLANQGITPIAPIALTAVVPVATFLAIYALSSQFRDFVLSLDIRTLTMLQHWRVVGFAFLPLYFFGVLPELFAWPAGVGDVAIGLAAPFVVARLARDPDWARSAGLVRFHLLGLLDFAVAIATANLASGVIPALVAGGSTSAPMSLWPLNIFPSFLVPIFIIGHLIVLLKLRHLRRAARLPEATALGTA